MELKQPAESDSDVLRLDHVNKKHPTKHHGKSKIKLPLNEGESNQKSLRGDWEKTLAEKDHHSEPSRAINEGVFRFDGAPDKEIHLHVDAEQIQEGIQIDNKSDPLWEPWHEKRQEAKPQQPKVATVEDRVPEVAEPMVAEAVPVPQSVDPALAAEALLHSQAVASITKEHAQTAVAPSYRSELPKEAQDIMDRLQPARDHHIEQSAWHNIEVDNKTGKAVEEPTFSYGEAFQNEQKTEANAFHTDDGVASASGQLAVSSPIFNNLNDRDAAILSGAQAAPTTPRTTSHSQIDFNSGPSHSSVDPLLWTILTVIVLAIFLALFI
jgi:hypothetical protein